MTKSLLDRVAVSVLATTLLIGGAESALAQSADARGTGDLEKENAALRARIHRLEVEKDNVGLRARLDQLQGRQATPAQVAARETAAQPARLEASAPDRTLVLADMRLKAPPAVAPSLYSWTGFYIGGNVGYSVGSDRARGSINIPGLAVDTAGGDTVVAPLGTIGGGQLGYNWQGGPNWLVGFEADFQGSAQKATSCSTACEIQAGVLQLTPTVTHRLDYFGTIRGRFGFVNDGALFYVTGGGAYGRVNQTLEVTAFQSGAGSFASASTIENKFGFVVGGGVESALGGNWTGKVEYLYMDLGSISTSVNGAIPPATPITFAASSNIHDNIVRAGLNYRFGPPATPLSAYDAMAAVPAAATIYSWTGFYVGANVGYGYGNDHTQTDDAMPSLALTSEPGTSVTPKGVVGGVQLGYNWQASPHWLIGFEADLQGAAQTDTVCSSFVCLNQTSTSVGSGTNFVTVQHQLDYFSTVRGRLGAVVNNTLFYATGGAAFAHVKQTVNVNSSISTPPIFAAAATTQDMIGYTVGGGIEAMLWGGWSAKAEYLYMNLGSISTAFNIGAPPNVATLTTNSTVHDHIVRIGASYHLDQGPGSAARY
jgi:outer membrane immunogenic protein